MASDGTDEDKDRVPVLENVDIVALKPIVVSSFSGNNMAS